ncbi:hypothetical protein NW739_01715 [Mycoplasmopsis felis]|uniref:hypothetical protein n=1 Tax=Mycoplasmopsis felis TaxID=33923 RepID=UPI0021DFB099|nr:hypothetical protein [Mycoplasmopsis felis]MCU9939519.1 hypothetical protein [Mycoplasmopsis felis]
MLIDDNETFATTIKGKVFTDNPKEFNIVLIHNPTKKLREFHIIQNILLKWLIKLNN